jgi:hypothetical protein
VRDQGLCHGDPKEGSQCVAVRAQAQGLEKAKVHEQIKKKSYPLGERLQGLMSVYSRPDPVV